MCVCMYVPFYCTFAVYVFIKRMLARRLKGHLHSNSIPFREVQREKEEQSCFDQSLDILQGQKEQGTCIIPSKLPCRVFFRHWVTCSVERRTTKEKETNKSDKISAQLTTKQLLKGSFCPLSIHSMFHVWCVHPLSLSLSLSLCLSASGCLLFFLFHCGKWMSVQLEIQLYRRQ